MIVNTDRNINDILEHMLQAEEGDDVLQDIVDLTYTLYREKYTGSTDYVGRLMLENLVSQTAALLRERINEVESACAIADAQIAARLDNVVSIPEGDYSTVSAAAIEQIIREMLDARVGDGFSYANVGAAIRQQNQSLSSTVKALREQLGSIKYDASKTVLEFTRNVAYSVSDGKVVTNTGQSDSWYAADPVSIDVGDYTSIKVRWYMAMVVTNPYIIIADDDDNVLYAEYGSAESAIFDAIIDIPPGATKVYFNHRLSVNTNRPADCYMGTYEYNSYVEDSPIFVDLDSVKKTLSISAEIVTIADERTLTFEYDAKKIKGNIIVECEAVATGPATIQFEVDDIYKSPEYSIGSDCYENKKWRLPEPPSGASTVRVNIVNPEDSVLSIRLLRSTVDSSKARSSGGYKLAAHLGYAMYPQNTKAGYIGASNAGFPACITAIRRTADGIYVCIHDDTINATARDINGDRPTEPIYVADITYAELIRDWDFGRYKSDLFIGERIPKTEEFFEICAKTGMQPIISTKISSAEIWSDIRLMAIRCGLLNSLHIKAFSMSNLQDAYEVFGDAIDGYTLDRASGQIDGYAANITSLQNLFGTNPAVRIGIEYLYSELSNPIAATACRAIVDAGMFVSTYGTGILTGAQYDNLKDYYITEITADYNTSSGLNW